MTSPVIAMRGGAAGAYAPFALFLAGVGWLALSGAPDERGFWPILIAALAAGLALARDRRAYADAFLQGMAQPIVLLMVLAWLLSGVLSTLLAAAGFVRALVWVTTQLGLSGGAYTGAVFLACAAVSTATGTSFGTILICGPLLYPAAAGVASDPVVLAGAILAGATFGDSISPISDTTIASSGTQQVDIGGTVRARLKYVLPAGAAAACVYLLVGGVEPATGSGAAAAGSADGWPMIAVPVATLAMLLAKRHLIEALVGGIALAAIVALPFGLLTPAQLLRVEPGSYAAKSLVIDGLERGVGVSVFTLLLVGLVAGVQASGALERLMPAASRTTSPGQAEWRIVSVVMAAVLVTTHSVVAILAVGDYARRVGEAAGLPGYRRANLLDIAVCTWPFLLPYFLPTILMSGATASGAAVGLPRVSALAAGLWNIYSWGLLAMLVTAVVTGFGRRE